jgi:hypothetical protein
MKAERWGMRQHLGLGLGVFLVTLSGILAESAPVPQGEVKALLEAGFRGERSEEAVEQIKDRIATLLRGKPRETASQAAERFGDLAAVFFAAAREKEGAAAVARLLEFARALRSDTLFVGGARRFLALPALRKEVRRDQEIRTLQELLKEIRLDSQKEDPELLRTRLQVALLEALGTAWMFDGKGAEALDFYRQARALGLAVYRKIPAPTRKHREGWTISCRVLPLTGLLSANLLLGKLDRSLELSDELASLISLLEAQGLYPPGHPARISAEGALEALEQAYTLRQKELREKTGDPVPITLEQRRRWKKTMAARNQHFDALAEKRYREGVAPTSPFGKGGR